MCITKQHLHNLHTFLLIMRFWKHGYIDKISYYEAISSYSKSKLIHYDSYFGIFWKLTWCSLITTCTLSLRFLKKHFHCTKILTTFQGKNIFSCNNTPALNWMLIGCKLKAGLLSYNICIQFYHGAGTFKHVW